MRKAFAPALVDDQMNVPQGAADLMGSDQLSMTNVNLQKPTNKRSRDTAVDTSTRSSSCSKPRPAATNTNKIGSASRATSKYRGVTRHRWTGRYEAHLWDKNSWNQSQSKKGRQVYLGAYDNEDVAARSYDLAALKYWGAGTILNFPIEIYDKEMEDMQRQTREEYIASLRRKSNGFSRGVSKYRGVARHHHNGRWEARIGRVYGNKYLYLGTYGTQEEAAIAYDLAALQYRGLNAVTNFDMSNYLRCMPPGQFITLDTSSTLKENENSDSNNTGSSGSAENLKASIAPKAAYNHQIHPLGPTVRHDHQSPLLRFCAHPSIGSQGAGHQGKDDHHTTMMIMQLEKMLGTPNEHLNLIQDQVSATCSAPPRVDHLQLAADAAVASYNIEDYSHPCAMQAKPAMAPIAHDPAHLSTSYHLEMLMAEYEELLQSPKPNEMLEKSSISAMVDTLSDTASSSTTHSLPSTLNMMSNDYLNHMIKPGGYLAGLLSPQQECIKSAEHIFDISDMIPGTTDSICSSNDLSSIQELVTCNNIVDIHCDNAIYPFHYNYGPSEGLMSDNSLYIGNNNMASLLPSTLNSLHHHYLQN